MNGAIPELTDPEIIDITCTGDGVVIKSKADIRANISRFLLDNNYKIKELVLEEDSLETIFLDTLSKGE